MAHEVYEIGHENSMAFVGDVPWHGLGQRMERGEDLNEWKKRAHLDWTIEQHPVEFDTQIYPERTVLCRDYDKFPLAIVSKEYKPVQPGTIIEFYRTLIDKHGFRMETAGSLREGRRIWALASVGKEGHVDGDKIRPYLLFMTACDGTLATRVTYTAIRVVCNNTLEFANSESQDATAVIVNHRNIFRPDEVKIDLGIMDNSFEKMLEDAGAMRQFRVTKEEAAGFFVELFHNPKSDDYNDVPKRRIEQLRTAWNDEQSLKENENLWGVVNTATRYADHIGNEQKPGNRLFSAWCGERRNFKNKVWQKAKALL